ncbi:MAG: pyridoxamine 5'-phosphate oxidase [Alphaproteobacteria bacterium]|nr:MAG: pyridoxamine 5'-phosphate oxidase [Alphaproteobacteria bacterium]PZO35399.1 MAG: pyridoxamine 5'-phosphate oxidase [Alphaproteobacteria bacterium]
MHTDKHAPAYPPINSRAVTEVVSFLDRERLMSIGVNRPDGWPRVTTMGHVNGRLGLNIVTGRESQKLANLASDSRISLAIHSDGVTDGPFGLMMSGHAHEVSDADDIRALSAVMSARWPDFSVYCPTSRSLAVVRFRPQVICVAGTDKGQSANAYFPSVNRRETLSTMSIRPDQMRR